MYKTNLFECFTFFDKGNYRTACLTLVFMFITGLAFSQTFDTKGTIAPPEINTGFMNNIHNSVDYQTGAVNFSIHLFSLKVDGNFEIPVNINYAGNGVKEYQASGEVGIGWSLSTNYRVARTIYNRPDEYFPRPQGSREIYDSVPYTPTYATDRYLTKFTYGLATNGGMTLSPGQVPMDGEYDFFDYATPTSSGTFIIEDVNNKTIRSSENLLAKFDFLTDVDGIRKFTIREANGYSVVAGEDPLRGGYMSEFTTGYLNKKYSYSWPVIKITTPANKEVQFTYVSKEILNSKLPNERAISISETLSPGTSYPATTAYNDIYDGSGNVRNAYLTDSILSSYGKVKFYRNSTEVIDSAALFDSQGSLIKKVIFKWSFSLGYNFLDSLLIYGADRAQCEKFKLEYYSRNIPRLTADIWDNLREPGFDEPATTEKQYPRELSNETYWKALYDFPYSLCSPVSEFIGSGADRLPRGIPNYLSLKKIILPTGGSYNYTYEANYFRNFYGIAKQGPGVRLSSSTIIDPLGITTQVHHYKYGQNGDGFGTVPVEITPDLFGLDQVVLYESPGNSWTQFFPGRLRSFSNTIMADSDPFFVRYNVVSYPVVLDSTDNGSTRYQYRNNTQASWIVNRKFGPGFFHTYDLSAKPYLERMDILDKQGHVKVTESYSYGTQAAYTLYGVKVKPYALFSTGVFNPFYSNSYKYGSEGGFYSTGPGNPNYVCSPVSSSVASIYDYAIYSIYLGQQVLLNKTRTQWNDNQSVEIKTNYTYNNYGQLLKETASSSNSTKELQASYIYPNDLTDLNASDNITSDIIKMQQLNMLNPWVERTESINLNNNGVVSNKLIGSEFRTIYSNTSEIRKNYFINFKNSQNFVPTYAANGSVRIDGGYDRFLSEIVQVDAHNNPIVTIDKQGVITSYVYGYNNRYVVAEIKGSDHATAVGYINQDMLNNAQLYTENQLRTELSKIRTGLGGTKAQVITYTHKPLVGITSETDPTGRTVYYEYDTFSRLRLQKDEQGNILKKYCYNYAGQPVDCN